ncbi:MAG: helix-turn-helix transcriptional regulator [Cyanophyceae cyanobacterium]
MAIELTGQTLHELSLEQGGVEYTREHFISRVDLPRQIGTGSDRSIQLRPGLELALSDRNHHQLTIVEETHDPSFPISAKFYLSGGVRTVTPNVAGIADDYEEVASQNYLFFLPDILEFEHFPAQQPIQSIRIYLQPDLLQSQTEFDLPTPLQQLGEGTKQRFHQPLGKTTPQMQQVLHQILTCPFQGAIQRLYWEGKAWELLALQLAQWTQMSESKGRSLCLRPQDIDRLYQARAFLLENLADPPSIIELAHHVGLNSDKLKRGFRQLFDNTVFGYIHEQRMQQAQTFLLNEMTIVGVATTVGYASATSFSTAFKRRFGISPKRYQITRRVP